VDIPGRLVEIYGSEGWGFESLRACYRNPREHGGFCVSGCGADRLTGRLGAILGSHSPVGLPILRSYTAPHSTVENLTPGHITY